MSTPTSLGLTKPDTNEYYDLLLNNINLDLLDQLIAARIEKAMIANNLLSDNPNTVLAATQGKALKAMIDTQNDNLAKNNYTYPDSFGGQTLTQILTDFVAKNYKYAICFYWVGTTQPADTAPGLASTSANAFYEFHRIATGKVLIRITTSTAIYSKAMHTDLVTTYIPWTKATNVLA